MAGLDEIDRAYGYLLGRVDDEIKEAYRRFEALFEQGLPPGPDTDWRAYGH